MILVTAKIKNLQSQWRDIFWWPILVKISDKNYNWTFVLVYFTVESKRGKPVLKGQGFFKHRWMNVGETIPSEDPVSDGIAESPNVDPSVLAYINQHFPFLILVTGLGCFYWNQLVFEFSIPELRDESKKKRAYR